MHHEGVHLLWDYYSTPGPWDDRPPGGRVPRPGRQRADEAVLGRTLVPGACPGAGGGGGCDQTDRPADFWQHAMQLFSDKVRTLLSSLGILTWTFSSQQLPTDQSTSSLAASDVLVEEGSQPCSLPKLKRIRRSAMCRRWAQQQAELSERLLVARGPAGFPSQLALPDRQSTGADTAGDRSATQRAATLQGRDSAADDVQLSPPEVSPVTTPATSEVSPATSRAAWSVQTLEAYAPPHEPDGDEEDPLLNIDFPTFQDEAGAYAVALARVGSNTSSDECRDRLASSALCSPLANSCHYTLAFLDPPSLEDLSSRTTFLDSPSLEDLSSRAAVLDPPSLEDLSSRAAVLDPPSLEDLSSQTAFLDPPSLEGLSSRAADGPNDGSHAAPPSNGPDTPDGERDDVNVQGKRGAIPVVG